MLNHLIRKIGKQQCIDILMPIAFPNDEYSLDKIKQWVASQGLDPELFIGREDKEGYSLARFVAWAHLRTINMPVKYIGTLFDGRDHSTIIYGIRRHNELIQMNDKEYAKIVQSFNDFFGLS